MAHILQHKTILYPPQRAEVTHNWWLRLMEFANTQEVNRVGWIGGSLMVQSAVVYPITMFILYLNGFPFALVMVAALALVLITAINVAGSPAKVIIPALAISILIDLVAIVLSFIA